jgi:hypothetical protein
MIDNLPGTLIITMRGTGGCEYDMDVRPETPKVELLWVKVMELINHVNDLEEKLLSTEEIKEEPSPYNPDP